MAIAGNGKQVWLQIVGALFILGWNIVWTSLIMILIKYVLRVDLRMSPEQLAVGDYAIHGEEPYTFAHYNRQYALASARVKTSDEESNILTGKDPYVNATNLNTSGSDEITAEKGAKVE